MRLQFTDPAENDLSEIGAFIAQDSPVNASRFIESLYERCVLLTQNPLSGRARNDIGVGLRSIIFGRYVILYHVLGDCLEIVRVIHGSRDIPRVLNF
jgi:toxin ParE1/3/4